MQHGGINNTLGIVSHYTLLHLPISLETVLVDSKEENIAKFSISLHQISTENQPFVSGSASSRRTVVMTTILTTFTL